MDAPTSRSGVIATTIRNYWWTSTLGGVYFVGGFVAWGGSRGAIVSSALFVVAGAIGLTLHYRLGEVRRVVRIALVQAHLLIGMAVLVWQKAYLPLSDYTARANPNARELLVYLVSSLIVGAMSMFGGGWGAAVGLAAHYLFIFDPHEEFSFKWVFPVLIALAGNIVSSASSRLEDAYEELETVASRDHLTGLFNRRRLVTEFARLQAIARETGRALRLVAWDLDDLKRVNDTQGHAAGDAYIRAFAGALQANVRKPSDDRSGDVAFRVGGDEFISLHLDGPEGDVLLSRVREQFAHVSGGWVRCEASTLDQALTQADVAMYADKAVRKRGRDQGAATPTRSVVVD
jgi:diguanylate cyclase (GGDEF)-like protein